MNILLVYPGIQDIGFDSFGRGSYGGHLQNLGMGYLSAYLKSLGHEVDFLDLRKMSGWEETAECISQSPSQIVGIQFNTVNFSSAAGCARLAREAGKLIVAGGPHASWAPHKLIDAGYADHVIVGEGEISLARYLDNPTKAEPVISGVHCESLDDLPFPDRHLSKNDLHRINDPVTGRFPLCSFGFDMIASRGCPFPCRFCQPMQRLTFGNKVRHHSAEYVFAHIEKLIADFNAFYVHFVDDTFTLDKSWTLQFCELMQKKRPGLRYWTASSRADCVNREILAAMRNAGCVRMNFGFESGSPRILEILGKKLAPEQSLETARLCHELGMLVIANFILGVPGETEGDMQKTLDLARQMKPDLINISYFTPIPGSFLYDECKKADLIINREYSDFNRSNIGQIKGIDYALTTDYMRKIENCATRWYESPAFSRLATDRWNWLSSLGRQDRVCEEISLWSRPEISVMSVQYTKKVARLLESRAGSTDSRFAIYGASQSGMMILNACLQANIKIVALYDRDTRIIGNVISGVPVKSPENINLDSFDAIVICSKGHEDEIYQRLQYLQKAGKVIISASREGLL